MPPTVGLPEIVSIELINVKLTPAGSPVTTGAPPEPTLNVMGAIGLLIQTVCVSVARLDVKLIKGESDPIEISSSPNEFPLVVAIES